MNSDLCNKDKKDHSIGIKVDLMSAEQTVETLWLPKQPEGRFHFNIRNTNEIYTFFYIEGENGKWYVCCKNGAFISNCREEQHRTELTDQQFIVINYYQQEYILITEGLHKNSNIYNNYRISGANRIEIGREAGNDIQYAANFVSRNHATLWWNNQNWVITDRGSLNGTYVNGERVHEMSVYPGDVIYIAGLCIVIGFDFLSMNTAGREIVLNEKILSPLNVSSQDREPCEDEEEISEENYFNRAPRRRMPMSFKPIEIEAPPVSIKSGQMPLLLRMGSSAVMGGRALAAGQFTMLLSSFVFPLLAKRFSDKERNEYEEKRTTMYKKYLAEKELEIMNERLNEQKTLNCNYSNLNSVLNYAITGERLWERQKTDDDFLTMRVGFGQTPLLAELKYPERHFEIEEDELEAQMYKLVEQPVYLENAPILSSFAEDYVCGVLGKRVQVSAFVKNIILNLTVLHSYDDVKTVFLISGEELKHFEFIRYLPHVWNNQRNFRFIATDVNEAYRIGEYIKQDIEDELENPCELNEILKKRPYYFIFALDKRIFDSMELLKSVLQVECNIGVTILAAFDELPKECSKIFQMNDSGKNEIIHLKQLERASDYFCLDSYDEAKCIEAMKRVANTSLKIVSQNNTLPKMVTFLEMLGVGCVEHLNVIERWKHNNPVKSLSTPVGVGVDGNVFNLDLHEKFQGPHGLVAGMTGSGKSEFLITYILSLAVNYRPDEVAFVLIDYKGGGLADAFDGKATGARLPHLMGTVTNLDGSSIQRSLMTLDSECKRRQRVFSDTKEKLRVGTMDIYSYQKAYRSGEVSEPMPHLLIISDEFAELKQQQPEFMDHLISIARIGRSLGIHLILATQKPSGVVNDQIRSNTKFRVCLKVQDKSDSMDMLKRPEAAEIIDTGRFCLQVGYNEYFALGQSAWCGAQYEPQDEVVIKRDDGVYFLDALGQTVLKAAPKIRQTVTGSTQLVEVVRHLSEVAGRENIKPQSLWTDPLPDIVDLNDYMDIGERDSCVKACLGLIDDPENQRQYPLIFDFQHCQNLMIVGEAGSGKTTLIQSILFSLAHNYSADDMQFYVLDYSSRLLKSFAVLPHCGAVLTEDDASALDNFFELINGIIYERKKLFAALEVDNYDDACKEKKLPLILVIIDSYAGLGALKEGASHLQGMQAYIRDGVNYGIKYIITCTHLNEVHSRVKQEIGDRFCLHMNDKYAYADALSCKVSYLPPEKPGRGLYVSGDVPLEVQCAMYCVNESSAKSLKEQIAEICSSSASEQIAKRLPHIPEAETYAEFAQQFNRGRIPLGYSLKTGKPIALPFKQFSGLSLYFGNETGAIPIWSSFVYAAKKNQMQLFVVSRKSGSFVIPDLSAEEAAFVECKNRSLIALWKTLSQLIISRKKLLAEYCADRGIDPDSDANKSVINDYIQKNTEPVLVLILCFEEFCSEVDEESAKVYDTVFKMAKQYNLFVIGGFYPDTNANVRFNEMYKALNVDENLMMFGGQTNRQPFGITELQITQIKEMLPYNYCIMKYKKSFYELSIPCGELIDEEVDEDDRSIF